MKVILLKDIQGLGRALDVKEVKHGYGFNYLLPEGLADLATPNALKRAQQLVAQRKATISKEIEVARVLANALSGKKVVIKSKAENGKLFGSVGRDDIVLALEALGVLIAKDVLVLDKAFKEVGTFEVSADFGHEVKAVFDVVIQAS